MIVILNVFQNIQQKIAVSLPPGDVIFALLARP
jgi:hypothetical protein